MPPAHPAAMPLNVDRLLRTAATLEAALAASFHTGIERDHIVVQEAGAQTPRGPN